MSSCSSCSSSILSLPLSPSPPLPFAASPPMHFVRQTISPLQYTEESKCLREAPFSLDDFQRLVSDAFDLQRPPLSFIPVSPVHIHSSLSPDEPRTGARSYFEQEHIGEDGEDGGQFGSEGGNPPSVTSPSRSLSMTSSFFALHQALKRSSRPSRSRSSTHSFSLPSSSSSSPPSSPRARRRSRSFSSASFVHHIMPNASSNDHAHGIAQKSVHTGTRVASRVFRSLRTRASALVLRPSHYPVDTSFVSSQSASHLPGDTLTSYSIAPFSAIDLHSHPLTLTSTRSTATITARPSVSSHRTITLASNAVDTLVNPAASTSKQPASPLAPTFTFPSRPCAVMPSLASSSAVPLSPVTHPVTVIQPGEYSAAPSQAATASTLAPRRRTSSIPLNLLKLSAEQRRSGSTFATASSPSPPLTPNSPVFACITPPLSPESTRFMSVKSTEHRTSSSLDSGRDMRQWHSGIASSTPALVDGTMSSLDLGNPRPVSSPHSCKHTRRNDVPLMGKVISPPLPSLPPTSNVRIHTYLPPLTKSRSFNFLRHTPAHTRRHSKSHTAQCGHGGSPQALSAGVVGLGLGIEFGEEELDSRCPSPYKNPREAPRPPVCAKGDETPSPGRLQMPLTPVSPYLASLQPDDDSLDAGELIVPDYVFERRGSATSTCTTSSARSTRTLTERLSSVIPRSLKLSKLRTRSKLNLSVISGSSHSSSTSDSSPFSLSQSRVNSSFGTSVDPISLSPPTWSTLPPTPHTPTTPSSYVTAPETPTSPSPGGAIGFAYGRIRQGRSNVISALSGGSTASSVSGSGSGSDGLPHLSQSSLGLTLEYDECEAEARAIGRVLTPESDPFRKADVSVGTASFGSFESMVDFPLDGENEGQRIGTDVVNMDLPAEHGFGDRRRLIKQKSMVSFTGRVARTRRGTGTSVSGSDGSCTSANGSVNAAGHSHTNSGDTITPLTVKLASVGSRKLHTARLKGRESMHQDVFSPSPAPSYTTSSRRSTSTSSSSSATGVYTFPATETTSKRLTSQSTSSSFASPDAYRPSLPRAASVSRKSSFPRSPFIEYHLPSSTPPMTPTSPSPPSSLAPSCTSVSNSYTRTTQGKLNFSVEKTGPPPIRPQRSAARLSKQRSSLSSSPAPSLYVSGSPMSMRSLAAAASAVDNPALFGDLTDV